MGGQYNVIGGFHPLKGPSMHGRHKITTNPYSTKKTCPELVLYGIWELASATPRTWSSTWSGPVWFIITLSTAQCPQSTHNLCQKDQSSVQSSLQSNLVKLWTNFLSSWAPCWVCLSESSQQVWASALSWQISNSDKNIRRNPTNFILPHLGNVSEEEERPLQQNWSLYRLGLQSPSSPLSLTVTHWPIPFQNQAPPWWKDPLMGPAFPSG